MQFRFVAPCVVAALFSTTACALDAPRPGATANWVFASDIVLGYDYVDPTTIRKVGGRVVSMWSMTSYREPQKTAINPYRTYLSTQLLYEYDCSRYRARIISLVHYSGPHTTGDVIFSMGEFDDWIDVLPGTSGEVKWKVACGKAKLKKLPGYGGNASPTRLAMR